MQIKKALFYSGLFTLTTLSVQAQMIDLMGSMAVGASQDMQAVQSVGSANRRLNNTQFIQELQLKIADISMTYSENYQSMPIQNLTSQRHKVIFRPVQEGWAFEAFISGMNKDLCASLLTAGWDNLIKIRVVSGGQSMDYTPQVAKSQSQGLCITANEIALIFQ